MKTQEIAVSKIERILKKRSELISLNEHLELISHSFSMVTYRSISCYVTSKGQHLKMELQDDENDLCKSLIDQRILKNTKSIEEIDLKLSAISSIMGEANESR